MPKTKISEYSATANSNTDVASINIDEGCAPSGINNAIRAVMGHLKDFQAGTNGDSFNGPVGTTTPAAGAFTTLSASGNVTLGDASSDTLNVGNGGLVKDSSGNVGIGSAPSATAGRSLDINGVSLTPFVLLRATSATSASSSWTLDTTNSLVDFTSNAWAMRWQVNGAERMRIDTSGNVGIGTSSPDRKVMALVSPSSSSDDGYKLSDGTRTSAFVRTGSAYSYRSVGANTAMVYSSNTLSLLADGTSNLTFHNGNGETARIDSSGYLLVGKTSSNVYANGFEIRPEGTCYTTISSSTGSSYHLLSSNSGTFKFYVTETGGVVNYSGNNVNLSDERTKTNIDVAGGYLDKICAIPVKLFNYKDEAEGEQRTLGVIAQDVEAVAPEFVNSTDGWKGTEPEDGTPLKTIYTTDMMFGLMNAIQELKAIVDAQAVEIAALKGQA